LKAEYIDHMGDDLRVVNAARVSFDKESLEFKDNDARLIQYLSSHNHWTPFAHCQVTIRETIPIFLARQRFKHTVGFVYNEVSRRYVDSEPEFYTPEIWRKAAKNKKQGSSDEVVNIQPNHGGPDLYKYHMDHLGMFYDYLVNEKDVCPEQARMVLPQSMYTSYYVTGSLVAWARLYNLRKDPDAQKEWSEILPQINSIIRPLFPISWEALVQDV
jgi:thymidylate synthase (FAD)